MSDKKMLAPAEIAEYTINTGVAKVNRSNSKVLVSAFLAGAYIAFGALGSVAASYNLLANPATYGLGKALAGLMFPAGLIFVLLAGADLFTGNILIAVAAFKKKVTWGQAAKNWALVWLGNLLGAIVVAWMVGQAGVFDWSNGLYGGVVLKTAIGKVGIEFMPALISGILCNWVVCVTVWITYASKDVAGKVLTGFIGIFLFVCTGFEHCVANMGYLFAAFFTKANPMYLEAAHKTAADVAAINFKGMFINNLLPVTIGNIIGGLVFVAGIYFFLFVNNSSEENKSKKAA